MYTCSSYYLHEGHVPTCYIHPEEYSQSRALDSPLIKRTGPNEQPVLLALPGPNLGDLLSKNRVQGRLLRPSGQTVWLVLLTSGSLNGESRL